MRSRIELQQKLEDLLGSRNVYFQPGPSVRMEYPAIVYSRNNIENRFANSGVYGQIVRYDVILVDKNPDSEFVSALSTFPMCSHDRSYKADNLNHDVFTLYY